MLNEIDGNERNLLLVNRAIDSRLRSGDLLTLRDSDSDSDSDSAPTGRLRNRATVCLRKTGRPLKHGLQTVG